MNKLSDEDIDAILNSSEETERIQAKIKQNSRKDSLSYYAPLSSEESAVIRKHYRNQLTIPENGSSLSVYNKSGTLLATGYLRVIAGDYGAYIECSPEQIQQSALKPKWDNNPNKKVKYIWLESQDSSRTKVYQQKQCVPYADYQIGLFYIDPRDIEI
jgi:hypothetical protein